MQLYPSNPSTNEPIALNKSHGDSIINVPWLFASDVPAVSRPEGIFSRGIVMAGRVEAEGTSASVFGDAFLTAIFIQLRSFGANVA